MQTHPHRSIQFCLFTFAAAFLTTGTACGQQVFEDSFYPTQVNPSSLAQGDFNHDGKIDFVVGDINNTSIAILLAIPEGGYDAPRLLPSSQASIVSVGDLNNDGNLDIVAIKLNSTHPIKSILGDGSGGFPLSFTSPFSYPFNSINLTDLNGDGALDALLAIPFQQKIAVCPGNGSGRFLTSQLVDAGTYPWKAAAGDINNDGKIDIIATNRYSGIQSFPALTTGDVPAIAGTTIKVLAGTGGGAFATPVSFSMENGPADVVLADANGDGFLDVIAANDYSGFSSSYSSKNNTYTITATYNRKISVALNDATGAFPSFQSINLVYIPRRIITTDLNGDGKLDFVASMIESIATSQFGFVTITDGILVRSFGDGAGNFSSPANISTAFGRDAIVADPNGDGNLDIVMIHEQTKTFGVLYNHSNGVTQHELRSYTIGKDPRRFAAGDLNGDGYPDVVTANATGCDATILLGSAAGAFSPAASIVVDQNTFSDVAHSDLDGDGILDILLGSLISGNTYIYKGNGDATFIQNQIVTVPGGGPAQMEAIAAGDLNSDGKPDLALGINSILIYKNDGTGLLNYFSALDYTGFPKDIEIADLNGDGIVDILSSVVAIHYGTGGGTFAAPLVFPQSAMKNVVSLSVGDVNNDDIPDFLACGDEPDPGSDAAIYSAIGDGAGSFNVTLFDNLSNLRFIISADANRDGTVDRIFGQVDGIFGEKNFVRTQFGDGAGLFSDGPSLFVTYTKFAVARDFDIDGKVDCTFVSATDAFAGGPGGGPGVFTILHNILATPQNTANYGSGTSGCRGMMGLSANSTPNIGNNTFAIVGTNAPSRGLGVGLAGDVAFTPGVDIFGYQFSVLVDPYNSTQLAGYEVLATDAGTTFTPFPIPNAPALVGLIFYIQQIFVENAANGETCSPGAFELVSSLGLSVLIY
ncbi:MAG: FG-GAP repeat domain-containing protein [Planctomycetota bacterium]